MLAGLTLLVGLGGPACHAAIVINEIMYNSPGSPDVEFIELFNTGPAAQDLTGWFLLDDDDTHTPCSLEGTLAPGEFLVVASSLKLFSATHPDVTALNPNACDSDEPDVGFTWGNAADIVRLFNASAVEVDRVAYEDGAPWPVEADGDGPSLELIQPAQDNNDPTLWRAGPDGGTPGAANASLDDDLQPVVLPPTRSPELPSAEDSVRIRVSVSDDIGITAVDLFVETNRGFSPRPMFDDGLHDDGSAGDGTWATTIEPRPSGSIVRYFIVARDTTAQVTTSPPGAPGNFFGYTVDYVPPTLEISEILASNQTVISDGAGDFDDWVELRNPGPTAVDLSGMYLSPDREQTRFWELPGTLLDAGETIVIWCDNEPVQGPFHATFRLPRAGGEVVLFDSDERGNTRIHGLTFGPQNPDISFGFHPDNVDTAEYLVDPTPGGPNDASSLFSDICINEFFASSQVGLVDWVELFNRGDSTIDLSGWALSDDVTQPRRYVIPDGVQLGPGEFISFDQPTLGFGFSADGSEVIVLTHADGESGQDYFDFGTQLSDISQGRFPDGVANWQFFGTLTEGSTNDCGGSFTPPDIVTDLRFDSITALSWSAADGATGYDLVRGDLLDLRKGLDVGAALLGCLENNSRDLQSWDPLPLTSGAARFFLVRSVNDACGLGSYDSGSAAQLTSRDSSTAAAICP